MRSFDHILGNLGLQRVAAASAAHAGTPPSPQDRSTALAYPPVDPGIPAHSIEEILDAHQDLINRIKLCYGADRAGFEQALLPLIRRYAEFVHLLPATPDNYFNAPGGLLCMGLEVAFFSLQGTDGHIFSGRSTITTRRHLEPRWRQATFIAGLCSEIHRTLSHVIVTDKHGDEWQPYLLPLWGWLAKQRASHFFLKWRPSVHESRTLSIFALPHVVPAEVLQHLAADNAVIVPHLMASISGMPLYREHNMLGDLVRRSVALVIDRHLQSSADRYGKPQLGSHLERYLVDALRRLISGNAAWNPNGEKSRVWFGSDGLFLVWPNAATEVRALLEADQLPGIPKAPETILEILIAAGVFEPKDAVQLTWQIVPPDGKTAIEAVKLSSPAILFAGLDPLPRPLTIALVRSPDTPVTPASPSSTSNRKTRASPQLPLPMETATTPTTDTNEHAIASAPVHGKPSANQLALAISPFSLEAPMRLNPSVRDALARIVDTLNSGGTNIAACTLPSGLFIPLAEFERRGIEPSLALRALAEVKMLVQPADSVSHTIMRDFSGEQKVGLLLHSRFVVGLDPGDFDTTHVNQN